jgi:hypothetical protein
MFQGSRHRAKVCAVAAVALLGGCASTGNDATPRTLDYYLGAANSSGLSAQERAASERAQRLAHEEIVATCMAAQGFDYIPDADNNTFVDPVDSMVFRLDDRAWVEKWGYGIVATPDGLGKVARMVVPVTIVNANDAYMDTLGEAELRAYRVALWGESAADGAIAVGETDQGCQGVAYEQMATADPTIRLKASDQFAPLFSALSSFGAGWYADSVADEWAALDAQWAACMADAGYTDFGQSASNFPGGNQQWMAEAWFYNSEVPPVVNDWRTSGVANIESYPPFQALATPEITLALADLDCREQVGYRDGTTALVRKAEQQFITDHHDELEAFRSAVEQAAKKP